MQKLSHPLQYIVVEKLTHIPKLKGFESCANGTGGVKYQKEGFNVKLFEQIKSTFE
jgi:hypothetical protein